ncbi:hypothetical protein, partial [Isoptericola hypogeus]|uniref:hypothetical protein n=1 Tax=Isoptericola hypogeus TaxID=300179 RepID=UPI0031CE31ED
MPREPEHRDYSSLIEPHETKPRRPEQLANPVPARCTARTYGGAILTVEGVVTHRAPDLVAFSAEYPGWGQWT